MSSDPLLLWPRWSLCCHHVHRLRNEATRKNVMVTDRDCYWGGQAYPITHWACAASRQLILQELLTSKESEAVRESGPQLHTGFRVRVRIWFRIQLMVKVWVGAGEGQEKSYIYNLRLTHCVCLCFSIFERTKPTDSDRLWSSLTRTERPHLSGFPLVTSFTDSWSSGLNLCSSSVRETRVIEDLLIKLI